MKNPKVFIAFFVTDDEPLNLGEIGMLIENKANRIMKGEDKFGLEWSCVGTAPSYIIVPKEAVPYGERTGIFPKQESEA